MWLHAAWTATALAAVVAAIVLPRLLSPSPPLVQSPSSVDSSGGAPLQVAIARTPGGPGEWANWARVVKHVSDEVGRPASLRYLSEEDKAAQVLTDEPADIAFVCAHTYLDLKDSGTVVGLASPLIDGAESDTMMLVVRDGSPYRTLKDLREARLAVSERTSLGGYAYAQWLAKREGVALDELFGEVRLGDTQEENLRDLIAGEIDVTVVNDAQVEPGRLKNLRVVERSPAMGPPPVVVPASTDEKTRDALLKALLSFDAAALPKGARITGFVRLDPADYVFSDELRRACEHHTTDAPRSGLGE